MHARRPEGVLGACLLWLAMLGALVWPYVKSRKAREAFVQSIHDKYEETEAGPARRALSRYPQQRPGLRIPPIANPQVAGLF